MTRIFQNGGREKKEEAVLIGGKTQERLTVNIPNLFWPQPLEVAVMKEVLKKIFAANPGKSKIKISGKCSGCGRHVIVAVEQTSGGFGLLGGILEKSSSEKYSITCIDCHKSNLKITTRRDIVRKRAF
jgi:hypothetical protein